MQGRAPDIPAGRDGAEQANDVLAIAEHVKKLIDSGTALPDIRALYWHPDCVSFDLKGDVHEGLEAIEAANARVPDGMEVIARSFSEPLVGPRSFAIFCKTTLRDVEKGRVTDLTKMGVFEVRDGLVVREEYLDAAGRFH